MPASPIGVKLKDYPIRWKWKQKVIIPDENTGTFFKIWYEQKMYIPSKQYGSWEADKKAYNECGDWYAWLMWCPFDENGVDNWGHVEELTNETRHVLDTIEMVFDISFHEHISRDAINEYWRNSI